MKQKLFFFFVAISSIWSVFGQKPFPERCEGNWEGTMQIYTEGKITDSVSVVFEVVKTKRKNEWTWITHYKSDKHNIIKDYKLIQSDSVATVFYLDEQDGIILNSYQFDNELRSVFTYKETLLTSCYTIENDKLIFEITSGQFINNATDNIKNYNISILQKVVLKRKKY